MMQKVRRELWGYQRKLSGIRKHVTNFAGAIEDHQKKLSNTRKHVAKSTIQKLEENFKTTKKIEQHKITKEIEQ